MSEPLVLAEQAARSNDYVAAEKYCKEHLATSPSDKKGLRLLALIYSLSRRHEEAIMAVSEVIALSEDKSEPSDYFNRGRWNLEKGAFADAVSDFSAVIELCARYSDDYYLEAAYLHRAVAFAQMGSKAEAQEDLKQVDDECQAFALGRLFSKPALSATLSL
jgi:tetratricopeptide (TPR) repeat protein